MRSRRSLDEQAALEGFDNRSLVSRTLGTSDFTAMVERKLGRMAPVEPARLTAKHHSRHAATQMPGPESGSRTRLAIHARNWLSNRAFKSYDEIVDHCCEASNKLVDRPWRIISIVC